MVMEKSWTNILSSLWKPCIHWRERCQTNVEIPFTLNNSNFLLSAYRICEISSSSVWLPVLSWRHFVLEIWDNVLIPRMLSVQISECHCLKYCWVVSDSK